MNTYILADNQYITCEGLFSLLHGSDDHTVMAAGSCKELQAKLRLYPKSAVILDYTLFDFDSVDHFLNMKAGAKESSWLLFSDELKEHFLRHVLLLDPTISVAMKHDPKEEIVQALECVANREVYLCETANSVLRNDIVKPPKHEKLTATERMILREIALGKMTKEIAWEKNLSFHTVNTHRRNIFRKLEINNVHEAVKYALQTGLIDLLEYYI
jgi:DNA-binding NarL/FixJ family response regulator